MSFETTNSLQIYHIKKRTLCRPKVGKRSRNCYFLSLPSHKAVPILFTLNFYDWNRFDLSKAVGLTAQRNDKYTKHGTWGFSIVHILSSIFT